ncbi:MAG: hypothetical protein R3A51_22640, partial [Nannocystaceae bacterium]
MGRGAGRRGDLGAALPGQALAAGAALLVALDRGPALARRVAVEAGGRPVGDYVYQGLLAVLLRLALRLHAEARGLAPAGLAALRADLDEETCSKRHVESRGAWPRLLALLAAGDGDAGGPLDLGAFPFLADAALEDPATRSLVDALTRVDGRPVDYRRLELEQLGGLLEALTGQRVVASPSGRMSLEAGSERRRAGVHYTPRALAEQVARRTLAPALGRSPSASSILSLRVCDPAMGAGVFLLAACRLLARALVRAWRREGDPRAEAVDAEAQARRLVAGRCLYGVDRSPLAVALTGHALALA